MTAYQQPEKQPELVRLSLRKLIADFRSQPNISGVLSTWIRRGLATDDEVIDVIDARTLDGATGVNLENLGALVGEAREGRNDATLRAAIRLRIRTNRSQGRVSDLFEIVNLLVPDNWSFLEVPYGYFAVLLYGASSATVQALALALSRSKPLGHQGELITSALPASQTIRFAFGADPGVSPAVDVTGVTRVFANVTRLGR